MKNLILTLLLPLTLLLSSCIDGEEEITFHENGSGSILVDYRIPQSALSKTDATAFEQFLLEIQNRNPSVHLKQFETTPEPPSLFGPTMQNLTIELTFESVYNLREIYIAELEALKSADSSKIPDPEVLALIGKVKAILGSFNITLDGLALDYNRTIDLEPLFEGRIKNGNIFGDSTFRYTVNLPTPAGENNATTVTNGGKTLQWTIGLKETFGKPIRMRSQIPAPLWLKITLIATPILILFFFILITKALIKKRRRKNPKPTYEPKNL